MTPKERLYAALEGRETDRPPVCFYEIDGYSQKPDNPDEYNIYNDPSWEPVLRLARDYSDRIVLSSIRFKNPSPPLFPAFCKRTETDNAGNLHTYCSTTLHGKTYSSHTLRERDVYTTWVVEHPFKEPEDLAHWLRYGDTDDSEPLPDLTGVEEAEAALGDTGIVCIDIGSPLLDVASMFSMEDFLVTALQERELMHAALTHVARRRLKETEAIAKVVPGRLWRIYGPEYACVPFLPPALFDEYSAAYDAPMADTIKQSGGFPRIHCHGRLKQVMPLIRKTGWTAIDPVEPPPQGDVTLREARDLLGEDITIFGNLEVNAIETADESEFSAHVRRAIEEGPNKEGRRFVLMPSSSPFGRHVSERVVKNYSIMIELCCSLRSNQCQ
ncbi:MAG: hypothetical protein LBS48_00900 [Treponema sp.]|jgi:hypothetical protein|nr:hypothetical protein [Treponema sp.]